MGRSPVKIGVLTSSRADYGIYIPLLRELKNDSYFELKIIAFGTHLSEKFGMTFLQIESDGFSIRHKLNTLPDGDKPEDIATSIGKSINVFSSIWANDQYDLILALGDRYEMFAAVASTVPFVIPVAHIHGGETTLGAIDNVLRNSITTLSRLHFTTCDQYAERVSEIIGSIKGVHNVGALSVDLMKRMQFLTEDEFSEKYHIDLKKPTCLFTFHPETLDHESSENSVNVLISVMKSLPEYQFVVTMPNADTSNVIIRNKLKEFSYKNHRVFDIENMGSLDYLSCMKHCSFMMGNSSSGFVEAAWFPKFVINVGKRQQGRLVTSNILTCSIDREEILSAVKEAERLEKVNVKYPYGDGTASGKIVEILKKFFDDRHQ